MGVGATVDGTITANAQTVYAGVGGYGAALVSISGTYGSVAVAFEASDDNGTTWTSVAAVRLDTMALETASGTLTNTTRAWVIPAGGFDLARARATAWTSGTAAIRITPTDEADALLSAGSGGGGGAATVADGADVAEGSTTDAAVTTNADGTLSAKLRGLVTQIGAVTASPVANTVQDRLKSLLAKLPALGTAGTASADVISVQGVASGTALPVGGVTLISNVTVAMTTHASYVSGDFVGTDATPLAFTNAVRVSGGTGILQAVRVVDEAVQSVAGELWLFASSVTCPSDSAAWSISDADAALCVGVVPISTYYASALNSIGQALNLGLPFKVTTGTTLFGAWVTRGAPTYASNNLVIALKILSD